MYVMFCPEWQVCTSRVINLYVMFVQSGKYVRNVLSREINMYVMFCPGWQIFM